MGWFSRSDDNPRLIDERAIERYRYMLRTAPPDSIEEAHEEAFSRLTPEQRRLALQQLATATTPEERRNASDDPKSLARLATRAEIRQPGVLERLFGSVRSSGLGFGGAGLGGMFAGSLLASVAGTFVGSAIAHSFFDHHSFQEGIAESDGDQAGVLDPQPLEEGATLEEVDYGQSDVDDIDTALDGGDFGEIV